MASKGPKWPFSWQFRQWTSQCWRTNVPARNNKGYSSPIFTISLCPSILSMISPRLRQIQQQCKTLSRKWVPATGGSPSRQRSKKNWSYVQETCKTNRGLFGHLRLLPGGFKPRKRQAYGKPYPGPLCPSYTWNFGPLCSLFRFLIGFLSFF